MSAKCQARERALVQRGSLECGILLEWGQATAKWAQGHARAGEDVVQSLQVILLVLSQVHWSLPV